MKDDNDRWWALCFAAMMASLCAAVIFVTMIAKADDYTRCAIVGSDNACQAHYQPTPQP